MHSRFGSTTLIILGAASCGGRVEATGSPGADGSVESAPSCSSAGCVAAMDGGAAVGSVVISAATRTPRTTTWSVNYWQWMASYGDYVTGTDALIAPLLPALLRVGGYNNDANTPNVFDDAAFDAAVAYAKAIGAQPIIQVPLLADTNGQSPTAATAAAMVTYANVTMGYGIKYFSIGNEPDLYASQGLPSDATQPAIPGYTPSAYCASAEAYAAAMKAVDSTIQIVGPDLSYKYQPGDDWLTPILEDCGDVFDVISIHRYPFEAAQATLAAAEADPASFRDVVGSVRGILQATGQSSKPLALTEMNVVYDATGCVLEASPGTVGSALWLADSLGTAIELGLWTSAVWDISDADDWSLGLLGEPPTHTPRPSYYAYSLYADHFGPVVLDVTSTPPGVAAHASRNQADTATEVIVANWNTAPAGLAFSVTGLASAPSAATFVLPAVSIAAVEIPDHGVATASAYAEAQRETASGPAMLAPGTEAGSQPGAADDDGGAASAGRSVGTNCASDASVCSQVVPPSAAITTAGTAGAATVTFGSGGFLWTSFTYAASGQSLPTATLTPDGDGLQIAATFVDPVDGDWEGVGLYFGGSSCLDVSMYTGVQFELSGDLGGCTLAFGATFSGDVSQASDSRGSCQGTTSDCYPPLATVSSGATTISVPFAALAGGAPIATFDPSSLLDIEWQLAAPVPSVDGGSCAANFTVENVSFY